MSGSSHGRRLHAPTDANRVVVALAVIWIALQVVGVIAGLAVVGREGGGPARHVDVPVHDWFVAHRSGLVGGSRIIAFLGDAPNLGAIVVLATLVTMVVAWRRGNVRWRTLGPLVAYVGAEATVYVVRMVIHRPRPPSANYPGPGAIPGIHETSWSFPSGHGTAPMAVLVALAGLLVLRYRAKWCIVIAVVAGLAVAATRLVLGVHWFFDVGTGAVLGGCWGAAVCWAEFGTSEDPLFTRVADGSGVQAGNGQTTTERSEP